MIKKQFKTAFGYFWLPECLQGFPVPLYALKHCRSGNTKKKIHQCFPLHTQSAPEMRRRKKNSNMITWICDLLNKSLNVQLSLTDKDQLALNLMLPCLRSAPTSQRGLSRIES